MNKTTPWLAAMSLLCPLGAQDEAAPPNAAARLKQLNAEQQQIVEAWREERSAAAKAAAKAKADGKPIPAMSMRPDFSGLRVKYLAAAKEYKGDEAVKFLLPALQMSDGPQTQEVFDIVLKDHLDSKELGPIAGILPYLGQIVSEDYAKEAVAKIRKHGKNLPLLAWAAFGENEKTLRSKPATSEEFLSAKAIVAKAVAKSGDDRLRQQFESLIAEQEKFGIGMVAPDIQGPDLDGVDFKLSDYKGKVVFLDFWGDW